MVTIIPQYPHWLYVLESSGATRADNGDFIAGTSTWTLLARCREETNGKGEEIRTADTTDYRFSSLVQLPAGTARVAEGTMIMVAEEELEGSPTDEEVKAMIKAGIIRIKAACAKYDKGRLHCRLWL